MGIDIFGPILLLLLLLVLPIVAIYRTRNLRNLEQRLAAIEVRFHLAPAERPPEPLPAVVEPPPDTPFNLETLVGQRLTGWIAIFLIFLAACFFLKYAFENRWIGEWGRVTLEVCAGSGFVYAGFNRRRKGWAYFSQVLTAGGLTILYAAFYGAFAYYHLIGTTAAFVLLVATVAFAHLLSIYYNSPAIAIVGAAGGFLAPVLLNTGRDQHRILFTYIAVLDAGVLALVVARQWRFLSSLVYLGTQLLFWSWYNQHYLPEKRFAALLFQTAVLLLFLAAGLARPSAATWEDNARLVVNPWAFYGISYALLNRDHHEWMGALALLLAFVYASIARRELLRTDRNASVLFATIGTALSFVTIAIPVQLDANWIAIAWALEAVAFIWAAGRAGTPSLRWFSLVLFALSLCRYLFWDTPWTRPPFTPILNRYYLETLAIVACLAAAAWQTSRRVALALLASGVLLLGSSVEAYGYFDARLHALRLGQLTAARDLRWASQLSLSLLWSAGAVCLTAAGFRYRQRAFRSAGLILFGLTLLKLLIIDTSELAQFYRIVSFLAAGLLLLGVAWAYQRASRREPGG